jgi:uncharacterized protein DUF1801
MASSSAATVAEYLAELPLDRRTAITRVRETINAALPRGFEEGMQYGMISWYVPLVRYPDTYNGQPLVIASLASQKGYMALYLISVYSDPALDRWFRAAYAASGKKLDMGKSCVRFASVDALPLDVIGEAIAKVDLDAFIARSEAVRGTPKKAAVTKTKMKKTSKAKTKTSKMKKTSAKKTKR